MHLLLPLALAAPAPFAPSPQPIETDAPDDGSAREIAWPGFRGPAGNSVLPERAHPAAWSADENVAWRVEVPGCGRSSPVVVGERVYLMTAVSESGGCNRRTVARPRAPRPAPSRSS